MVVLQMPKRIRRTGRPKKDAPTTQRRVVENIPKEPQRPHVMDSHGFALGYLFPEKFPPERVPDKTSLPSSVCSLVTHTTFTLTNGNAAILWNPNCDTYLLSRRLEIGSLNSALYGQIISGALSQISIADTSLGIDTSNVGTIFNPLTKRFNSQWAPPPSGGADVNFGASSSIQHMAAARLVGAYLSLEYTGSTTAMSGMITRVVVSGYSNVPNASFLGMGSNLTEVVEPLDFKQYLFRFRHSDIYNIRYSSTLSGGFKDGPYYMIIVSGAPANAPFIIKSVRHLEFIPLPSVREITNPGVEDEDVAELPEQVKAISAAATTAPEISSNRK